MSLPSIPMVAQDLGYDLDDNLSVSQQEEILVEAMQRDLCPAVELLRKKACEAKKRGFADWIEDPNSPIGKMLIRIHAGDELRRIASEYFCNGLKLHFFNCCSGRIGKPDDQPMLRQIQCQAGPIAHADC